jgi:hypothetical protein
MAVWFKVIADLDSSFTISAGDAGAPATCSLILWDTCILHDPLQIRAHEKSPVGLDQHDNFLR